MKKISSMTFKDVDTRLQFGLEINNCMTTNQVGPTEEQVLVPMQWATRIANA